MDKNRVEKLSFLYVGFFLTSSSLLVLQILHAEVLQIVVGVTLEFLIISLAILGMGLGGIFVFLKLNNLKTPESIRNRILLLSVLYAVLMPLPFLVFGPANSASVIPSLVLFFLVVFTSYFLAGTIISIAFRYYSEKISKLYFLSLMGSAFGAIGVMILLEFFGMPKTIILVLLLASLSVLFYAMQARINKIISASVLMLFLAPALLFSLGNPENYFRIVCFKYLAEKNLLFTSSNAFSQIGVYTTDEFPTNNPQYRMRINCEGQTTLITYKDISEMDFLKGYIKYFPYLIKNFSTVLIIGSGAGIDVVGAVHAGISDITAVEINPLIIKNTKVLSGSNNIYDHKYVTLSVKEGRSFTKTSSNKYDLIYIAGSRRFGNFDYSSHTFAENYLYTKEAFNTWLAHLNTEGFLVIKEKEGSVYLEKYIETIISYLQDRGINPTKRIILITTSNIDYESSKKSLILVKNSDFSTNEKDKIIVQATSLGFDTRLITEEDIVNYGDAKPLTDNNPFVSGNHTKRSRFTAMYILLISVVFLCLLFVWIPLLKIRRFRSSNVLYLWGFFSSIGVGFIALELAFIHKFTLFLGHPLLSISAILTSVLFFGGLGSLLTSKFKENEIIPQITKIVLLLASTVILFSLFVDVLIRQLMFLDTIYKILFSIVILSIPSFFMGMLFPLGLKVTKRTSQKLIPWMVGVDGIASVLGGILSWVIVVTFGFNASLVLGVIVYLLALLIIRKIKLGG